MPAWLSIPAVLQLVVGLGLLNVWLVRPKSSTAYRGGGATSLREEFEVYGLPRAAFYVVGAIKVAAAVVLIVGVWVALPVREAAAVIMALMIGAIAMHVKAGDAPKKSMPAAIMLLLSGTIVLLTS
jgi:uncharacterized membrane protein YphA (DoxX/SURF4 family)